MSAKTGDVLSASSLSVSTVTAAWFAMMPSYERVRTHSTDDATFSAELRHAEFMVATISTVFAAVVVFYLKSPVPLILSGATLALLLLSYEKQFRTN